MAKGEEQRPETQMSLSAREEEKTLSTHSLFVGAGIISANMSGSLCQSCAVNEIGNTFPADFVMSYTGLKPPSL